MADDQHTAEVLKPGNEPTGVNTTFTAGPPRSIPLSDHPSSSIPHDEEAATGREIGAALLNRAKNLASQVTSRLRGEPPQTGKQ